MEDANVSKPTKPHTGNWKNPPEFKPKLSFRVTCNRSKQEIQFDIPTPMQGTEDGLVELVQEKVLVVLKRLGLT